MKRLEGELSYLCSTPSYIGESVRSKGWRFVYSMIRLWEHCGGEVGRSRNKASKGKPSGPLIRYLTVACHMVMGENAPKPDTLVLYIKRYQRGQLKRPRSWPAW
jgi:hypothetical protein